MNLDDLSNEKRHLVDVHLQQIMVITGVKIVTVQLSNSDAEECASLDRILYERHGYKTFDPERFRPVAIMAADREPSDAAKAIEDVTIGNPNASRVFDAVAEAFGRLTDGDHVQLDIHIDNDRVSIEHWMPPRSADVPLGALKEGLYKDFTDATREAFAIAQPGEKISPTTASDIPPMFAQSAQRALAFKIGQKVFVTYGDQQVGPARITAYGVYEKTATMFLAEWVLPDGTPKTVWCDATMLMAAQGEAGAPRDTVATDHQRV